MFEDNIITYVEKIKGSTKMLLDLLNSLNKVEGHRSIKISIVFLHTNNEQSDVGF